mmetsp:Transcript_108778/g.249524  ORF Transcript_108778/g.249524 Transcript_108778/m.249524 type:complete len:144 (+) Transcript_108778:1122-1553(+)
MQSGNQTTLDARVVTSFKAKWTDMCEPLLTTGSPASRVAPDKITLALARGFYCVGNCVEGNLFGTVSKWHESRHTQASAHQKFKQELQPRLNKLGLDSSQAPRAVETRHPSRPGQSPASVSQRNRASISTGRTRRAPRSSASP